MKRPLDYHSHHCIGAIECLSLGHSAAAFAGEIGVARTTLLQWAKEHPEFADALEVGRAKAVAFWERALADIAKSGKGNATAAIFALKNCAAEDEADSAAETGGTTKPRIWSDLELARRIAHILTQADKLQSKGNLDDAAIS